MQETAPPLPPEEDFEDFWGPEDDDWWIHTSTITAVATWWKDHVQATAEQIWLIYEDPMEVEWIYRLWVSSSQ